MTDFKLALSPMDSKLKIDSDKRLVNCPFYYKKLVGKLIYLTITRPNISFVVSLVCYFIHDPIVYHLYMLKHILRYLKGSIGHGVVMSRNGHTNIEGYTNSDWAGNSLDRCTTTS